MQVIITPKKYAIEVEVIPKQMRKELAFMEYHQTLGTILNGGQVHPNITKSLEIRDNEVYLKPRWPKELCKVGGLHKKNFVYAQFVSYELQEQYELGNVNIEYWLNKTQLYPQWDKLPSRDGKDSKRLIKEAKKRHKISKTGCPTEATHYRFTGYVPLCCMCNKDEMLILRNKL